jgi:hypothetical protein
MFLVGGSTVNLNFSILSNHSGTQGGHAIDGSTDSRVNFNTDLSYNNKNGLLPPAGGVAVSGTNTVITPEGAQNLYISPGSPNFDYHLNRSFPGGNPAIDRATGSTTTVDLDNNPRDSKPDLGAYEAVNPRVEFFGPVTVAAGGKATVTINRVGDPSATIHVQVAITGGSAVAGTNFQQIGNNGVVTLTFAPEEKSKTLVIQTMATGSTADTTINLTLSLASDSQNLARLGNLTQTTVTIGGGQQSGTTPSSANSGFHPITGGGGIKGLIINFSVPLNPKQAKSTKAYALHKISGRKTPKIKSAKYNAGAGTVTLKFTGPLKAGSSAQLVINPAKLTGASGQTLSLAPITLNA